MGLLKIGSFLKDYGENLIFFLIFLGVLFLFLKDFKLLKKRSWGVLLGLMTMGGLTLISIIRKKKLLDELKAREDELENIEKRFKALQDKREISEAAYKSALEQLDRAKKEAALAVTSANREFSETVDELKKSFQNISGKEAMEKAKQALQR